MQSASNVGQVLALFVSPRHGEPMQAREEVRACKNHGFEDDAHARPGGHRQVLLLDSETLREFGLAPGVLKENITTLGVNLSGLKPGQRLHVGQALLEITQECAPCSLVDAVRAGLQEKLQDRRGVLARVLEGGRISVGDAIRVLAD